MKKDHESYSATTTQTSEGSALRCSLTTLHTASSLIGRYERKAQSADLRKQQAVGGAEEHVSFAGPAG